MRRRAATFVLIASTLVNLCAATNIQFDASPHTRLTFDGFVGERIRLTAENWLEPAPIATPGILEMFQLRDREPAPNLVPWAGEFVGKYLISAIQFSRLGAPIQSLRDTISQLIASQA